MNIRFSRLATGVLAVAAVVLMAGRCWAIFYGLGPSKDEWKLKYDVVLKDANADTLTVVFTVADEGRLKPIYSIDVLAFSEPDRSGGRSYLLKAPIKLETTTDGKRAGEVQIPRKFLDVAVVRILTQTVDGQRQQYAAYYDIPLNKLLNKARTAKSPQAPPSIAAPPSSKLTK